MPSDATADGQTTLIARVERQLTALKEIGLVLESTMSLDDILAEAMAKTTHLMDAERTSLFVVDEEGHLVSRVLEGGGVLEIRLAPGQGIAGWVARNALPLRIDDAYADERFDKRWDGTSGFVTRSILCQPIRSRSGRVIGVVEVLNKRGRQSFDDSDLEMLALLSGQLALTLENSRLLVDLVAKNRDLVAAKQDLERSNRELDLLLEVERTISQADSVETLAESILRKGMAILGGGVGVLYRADQTGAHLRVVNDGRLGCQTIRVETGTGIIGWVATKGKELVLNSAPSADPRFDKHVESRIGVPLQNAVAVPLLSREGHQPLGSLLIGNKKSGAPFEEGEVERLRFVAARLSQALEQIEMRTEQERERRLATVGRLLAGVLHDLKTPISVVSGYAELLAEKAGDDEAAEYLVRINRALLRITKMTEEIIAFSKGERRILLETVLLRDLMSQFLEAIQPAMERNGIELSTQVRTSGTLRCDSQKLLRALGNIALNAIEAMQKGGKLTVEVDQLGRDIVFGFTDTGAGIPEEIQGSMFQSFVTLGKEHGTGLGLSVAKEIIEAHGGKINFTTVQGRGTTFLICVPAT